MFTKILSTAPYFYFLFLPCVFLPALPDSYELPKIILFIISVYLYTALYITGIISHEYTFVKYPRAFYLLPLLFTALTFSSLLNRFPSQSIWGQYFRYQGLITIYCYLLFLIIFIFLFSFTKIKSKLPKIIAFSGLLQSAIIFLQAILFFLFHLPIYNYNGRLTGFFGNPNFTAGFIALSLPFGISYLNKKGPKSDKTSKILFLIYLFILFIALLFTGSRSGLLAFLILIFILFWGKSKKYFALLLLFCTICLVILFSGRDISTYESRTVIWQKGFSAFLEKPFFGWGVENFEIAFQNKIKASDFDLKNIRVDKAHNEMLEILVTGGAVSLIIYLSMLFVVFRKLSQNRQDPNNKTYLYAFIVFLILSQFNVLNITEYLFFYLILAFVFMTNKNLDKSSKQV